MSKEMTSKEKLLFIASFMWAMHWGVRVAFAAISTLEMKLFYCFFFLTLGMITLKKDAWMLLNGL